MQHLAANPSKVITHFLHLNGNPPIDMLLTHIFTLIITKQKSPEDIVIIGKKDSSSYTLKELIIKLQSNKVFLEERDSIEQGKKYKLLSLKNICK